MSIREATLTPRPLKIVGEVDMPEWGCKLPIRKLKSSERIYIDRLHKEATDSESNLNTICKILVMAIVEPDGTPAFTDDDIPQLCEKPLDELEKVLNAILVSAGMVKGAIEEAEKN